MLSCVKLAGYTGEDSMFRALLPAAATKMCPALRAFVMASESARLNPPPPPQLLFDILAPCATAKFRALMAPEVDPLPVASRNFRAMIWTFQFTPVTPMPLLPAAPIVPATCVPWLLSSIGLPLLPTKL